MNAVGIVAFVSEVPNRLFERDSEFVDGLGAAIAIEDVELRAFLYVDDER
jgi:hypothetical protein